MDVLALQNNWILKSFFDDMKQSRSLSLEHGTASFSMWLSVLIMVQFRLSFSGMFLLAHRTSVQKPPMYKLAWMFSIKHEFYFFSLLWSPCTVLVYMTIWYVVPFRRLFLVIYSRVQKELWAMPRMFKLGLMPTTCFNDDIFILWSYKETKITAGSTSNTLLICLDGSHQIRTTYGSIRFLKFT